MRVCCWCHNIPTIVKCYFCGRQLKYKSKKVLRRLSECEDITERYAFCPVCKEFFHDDITCRGIIDCPNNCDNSLFRKITRKEMESMLKELKRRKIKK